nr:glycine betaine ABC transporter substrate-binding protein [Mycolicibacterium palauense]
MTVLAPVGCGGSSPESATLAVGSRPDGESVLLANLYAAALRFYGTPAEAKTADDPLAELDAGRFGVVPGFTGRLLHTFDPSARQTSDKQVYRAMVGALPEGIAAGDYTTAAEDKPALAVTEPTARAWGGRDLTDLVARCTRVEPGAVRGAEPPATLGDCRLSPAEEFGDDTELFDALRAGRINAAWTSTADPDTPPDVVVLADGDPSLIGAENVVPLYRRHELDQQQVLAVNEVAGVLDTAALNRMRGQVDDGADPRQVAEAWLAENPLGR